MAKKFRLEYERDPFKIYEMSFIEVKKDISGLEKYPENIRDVLIRTVHATANPNILNDVKFCDKFMDASMDAISNGCNVLCDSLMLKNGIIKKIITNNNEIICTLRDDGVEQISKNLGTTKSAAAVELWKDKIENSIVVIGNAPTCLFHLIEGIKNNELKKPKAIIALPIGYIGSVESKQALIEHLGDEIPYYTVLSKFGGSSMASSVINALFGANNRKW